MRNPNPVDGGKFRDPRDCFNRKAAVISVGKKSGAGIHSRPGRQRRLSTGSKWPFAPTTPAAPEPPTPCRARYLCGSICGTKTADCCAPCNAHELETPDFGLSNPPFPATALPPTGRQNPQRRRRRRRHGHPRPARSHHQLRSPLRHLRPHHPQRPTRYATQTRPRKRHLGSLPLPRRQFFRNPQTGLAIWQTNARNSWYLWD